MKIENAIKIQSLILQEIIQIEFIIQLYASKVVYNTYV